MKIPILLSPLPRSERLLAAAIAAAALVIRAVAWLRYRFDSDEQQHLHAVWGWTAGLVQYRDYFDNHTPLFHILFAPILGLLGERSDILLWMRLPMMLFFAWSLYTTWRIGRLLFDTRTALWAVLLLALFPPFFLKSLEFRNDNAWTALCLLALLLALQRRFFLTGLVLGCAFAVSMKTAMFVVALLAAAAIMRFLPGPDRDAPRPRDLIRAAAGFLLVPAVLAAFFASAGAWDELVYCTVTFNAGFAKTRDDLWIGRALFPFMSAALLWVAWRNRRTAHAPRFFVATVIAVYVVTVAGFGILISPRDFLPLMAPAAIFGAAAIGRMRRPLAAFTMVILLFVASLWYYADRFENNTDWHTTMMDQALRLTRPGERIADYKGETIYRRRPFYYAYESVTRAQMKHGLIADTLPEDVIRTRTFIAQADGPMWPPRAKAFLSANFLNMGRLRAAGQWIDENGTFTIALPGEYVIVNERGEGAGVLDGTPYRGARSFEKGPHRFERTNADEPVAVLWAPAFRRGHSPFHLRDLEF